MRLLDLKEDLIPCVQLLDESKYDAVRRPLKSILTQMTFSGYTGESVKSRAAAWYEAGDQEKFSSILKSRSLVMKRILALENALYAAQINNKKEMLSPAELQTSLAGVTEALDELIPKMECDQRWRSGKCEILPEEKVEAFLNKRSF